MTDQTKVKLQSKTRFKVNCRKNFEISLWLMFILMYILNLLVQRLYFDFNSSNNNPVSQCTIGSEMSSIKLSVGPYIINVKTTLNPSLSSRLKEACDIFIIIKKKAV